MLNLQKKYILQQYFIPSANLDFKIKDDKIPYDIWEKRGLVTICEGAKVDYTDVTQWFIRMKNDFEIATLYIGYDPWNSNYWISEMENYRFYYGRNSPRCKNNVKPYETIRS